ncbi:MAG TPA: hypothetical protein VFU86_18380 [Terriglobales bacterium]|nr:hypothetical protein [Terriglobales bacterium]
MRRMFVLAAALLTGSVCIAQNSHKFPDYAGTWQANFHGKPFMTLKLLEKDGKLTGTVSHGNIEADPNGDLTKAEAAPGESEVVESRLLALGDLELKTRDQDSDDLTTIVFKLSDEKTGSIRFVIPEGEGVPKIKPFKVEKVESKS